MTAEAKPSPDGIPLRTVIGYMDCPGCKQKLPVQVGSKGKCYAMCDPVRTGAKSCGTRLYIGVGPSKDWRDAYLKAQKDTPTNDLPAEDDKRPEPAGDPAPEPGPEPSSDDDGARYKPIWT